jgi:uncharacterized membrane protein
MESSSTCPTCGEATAPRYSERTVQLILTIDRAIYRIARHWLGFLNSLLWGWVALIFLAPILAAVGYQAAARPIYAYNGLFCHQRPDRSFYVLGEKMACCQRCAAIYSSMALLGLLYVALRGRVRVPSWRTLGLLAAPVAVDGLTQLIGLRESTAALRVVTGALLGLALCWLLFPYLETGFAEMRAQLERRFARLVAEGRAQPL